MRGKSLYLFLGITFALLALVFFSTLGIKKLNAAPTASDVVLTNIATLNWTGGSTGVSNIMANGVGTNYGASWIGENDKGITPGNYQSNVTYLTNDGNAQATFYLYSLSNLTRTASLTWTNWFTNMTDGGARGATLTINISPAGMKQINFEVFAPVGETNTAYITYNCLASNVTAAANTGNASNYTGMNSIVYGGTMGLYAGFPYTVLMTNGQANFTNWIVTVSAANMTLAKTVNISNASPYGSITTVPYPGALIVYKLAYENVGAASATTVRIIDTIPTNYVTYTNDTIVARAFGDTFVNYFSGGGTAKSDAVGDDDASTNDTAANQLVFCPSAGTAPNTGGTVASAANGSYFFRVLLK